VAQPPSLLSQIEGDNGPSSKGTTHGNHASINMSKTLAKCQLHTTHMLVACAQNYTALTPLSPSLLDMEEIEGGEKC
jgi:hypothetical protein